MDYLESQFINVNDAAGFTEEELITPIMSREEFEQHQAVELYQEKATRAGELWDDVLKGISNVTHKWKWEYMDYLEEIKYQDMADVTLEMAKEEILSYEEFAKLKEMEVKDTEKAIQEQDLDVVEGANIVAVSETATTHTALINESQVAVVSEEAEIAISEIKESVSEEIMTVISETEEMIPENTEVVSEVIDYTKLSVEERALLLSAPTDDYTAEYDAYCQRMGYTAEKMKSIRYKMAVYDEFLKEYQYRKKHYGLRDDFQRGVSEKIGEQDNKVNKKGKAEKSL